MAAIRCSEEELELMLLALEAFKKHTLPEYDDESRPNITKEVATLSRKLRDA